MKRLAVAVAAVLLLAGCAEGPPTANRDQPWASGTSPLTKGLPEGAPCAGVGLNAILHGDPDDPQLAWLVTEVGTRVNVAWPIGYRARFNPTIEVLDHTGMVVLREGDRIHGGCTTDATHEIYLEPPF